MWRRVGSYLCAAALLAACGSTSPGDRFGPADAADGDGGAARLAVDSVAAGGRRYTVTCAQPAPHQLGGPVELDQPDPRFDEVVQVVGEEPMTVIALRSGGAVERCPSADWVLAYESFHFDDQASTTEYARLRCKVPAVPDEPSCDEGGPFWYGTDPSVDGTEGDGRRAVWVEGSVPEPEWRLDALEVVAREVGRASDAAPYYLLRRVGLRLVEDEANEVVVEAVYQDIIDNDGTPWPTQQREHHTLGRLPGRAGWYETEYIVAEYGSQPVDERSLDEAWDDLDLVLVEVDRR